MAGRVQLQTSGPQDAFFTDDPEYTYFIKNFQKHTNFAPFFVDLDVEGEVEFGNTIKCTIPQNQGDLLKTVSMKVELSAIDQSLTSGYDGFGYVESIGHAMIEYAELLIGGQVVQRIPSDFLAIYSDNYVTQTKQHNLDKLIGKPPLELSGTPVSNNDILGYLGFATSNQKYFVDIPFYFYNNTELAVPLCAITGQEIEIVIKLRDVKDCIYGKHTADEESYYTGLSPTGLIKSLKITTEMASLDEEEKQMLLSKRIDYIITQVQESKAIIPVNTTSVFKHKLEFKNPIKELFFVIQRIRKIVNGFFVSSFNYDSPNQIVNNIYTNYENLDNLELILDDSAVLNKQTGNVINLRAVQSGIHHSRTQLFRRYYSYSFALEPERWYPTGQLNFSLIKEQILKLTLHPDTVADRELRVLGLSYNILRVENGIAKTLFNL
ncbi:hypothetical protein [Bathycoccus sp. RCC716 virus 1]|uniref:Major capsid protein n=1 Tax=Bathycoccus sp. RCC716 virus 1 TaxID=2530038 RepID=A0A7S6NXS4_9PHYC|nr:hypothetical protein [Bathycoccus sp. RCC716 virus 1]